MLKKLKTLIFKERAKAVIFDYDGVLNNSLAQLRTVWNEFYKRGISNKYFETDEEFSNYFQGDPVKNLTVVGVTEEDLKKCDDIIREVLPDLDKEAELYDGIESLMKVLKSEGYKIGIVSNGLKPMIEYKLKKYSIDDCIGSIIGHDEVYRRKPNPEGLYQCMDELCVKPSETIYVGDMESDVKAGKAAGVRLMIAVRYGYLNLSKKREESLKGADKKVDTVLQLYKVIKNV